MAPVRALTENRIGRLHATGTSLVTLQRPLHLNGRVQGNQERSLRMFLFRLHQWTSQIQLRNQRRLYGTFSVEVLVPIPSLNALLSFEVLL